MLTKIFIKIMFFFISIFKMEEAYIKIYCKNALDNFILLLNSEEKKNSNISNKDLSLIYIYYLAAYLPKSELKQKIVLELLENLQRKAEWILKNK